MYKIIVLLLTLQLAKSQSCLQCKTCVNNSCQECSDGFMLSSQGWCGIFTPIEGCKIYDYLSTNRCLECNTDRTLIDSRCYLKPENCEVSDVYRECLTCSPGFTLFNGKCYTRQTQLCPEGSLPVNNFCQPLRAQNCQRSSGDNQICTLCNTNYTLINGRCLRILSIQSCPSNICTCQNGYIYNQNCYQISIDQCTFTTNPLYCSACEEGFLAIDGICLVPVKIDDVNCNVKAPLSDYCTGCNQDYVLNTDAFCVKNFNLTTCPEGGYFTLQNGRCLYRDIRCEAVDFRITTYPCLRCQEGFSLVNGICQRNICIRYNAQGICTSVFPGYTIIGPNQFVRIPSNCLIATSTQGSSICTQCSQFTQNTTLNPTSSISVCAYYDPNCVQYNLNGSCVICANDDQNDGYVLKNRFCFQKAQNCVLRDSLDQSVCITCANGYHLDTSDRKCYLDVAGCEVYFTGSDCKQCQAQNYLLYNKKCFPVNSECVDMDTFGNCRKCINGFIPFKTQCVYYHPYCVEYGADKVCSRAAYGWSLGEGMNEEQKTYYRNFILRGEQVKNRNDVPSLTGLSSNSSSSSSSAAGSYSSGALITAFPYANVINIRVLSINMFGVILTCAEPYTLFNNQCIQIVSNCEKYSQNLKCVQCAPQYTLSANFTCIQGLQCASIQDVLASGRCARCATGYVMIGIQCFAVGTQSVINSWLQSSGFFSYTSSSGIVIAWPLSTNCASQLNLESCTQCLSPYQLFENKCVLSTPKCQLYSPVTSICQSCLANNILWFNQCRVLACSQLNNGLCQSCPTGFYYYFGLCLANSQANCVVYDSGICQLCSNGLFSNALNQCQNSVVGCLTTSKDTGRCLECRSGLALYMERCVNFINYCQDYDVNSRCTRCQSNTVNRTQLMSDNTCGVLEGQCAQLNQTSKLCASCNAGFVLITQDKRPLCVNQRDNCVVYDIRGRCVSCSPKFVLQNGQCRIYLPFCLVYSSDQLSCTNCVTGTNLANGCCQIQDSFCLNYVSCICSNCMTGYFLNSSGRCQNNPSGCDVYNNLNDSCIRCSSGFYLMQNGKCMRQDYVINGCQSGFNLTYLESKGYQCVKCLDGFVLNTQDLLCYGYNCAAINVNTRACVNCPPYYRVYRTNNTIDTLDYCIPYFCEVYIPGQAQCVRNVTTYYGGHKIIVTTRTVTITYCLVTDEQYRCSSCSNYRYPSLTTLYHLCYPYNCESTTEFLCSKCKFGYTLDSRFPGSCVASFCSNYSTNGSCLSCTLPYTLSSSGICENTGCCEVYDNALGVCRTAKKYFTIQNNICTVQNCLRADPTKIGVCLQCETGFSLFLDGTCRASYCQQDSLSGDSCLVCNPGYINYFGTSAKATCRPQNCSNISTDLSSCFTCIEGFTLDPMIKLCKANFCSIFSTALVCQTCNQYYRLQNNTCVADCASGSTTRCRCCSFGLTLNTQTGLCQPVNSFCLSLNNNTGLCTECIDRYNLVSGQCVAPVSHCKTPSTFGCLACDVGFRVVDNCRCEARNCVTPKDDGICSLCHTRFELTTEGLCKPRDCQSFSTETWSCNACYGSFQFQDGMCVTTNCDTWADFENTTCQSCKTASYLSSTNFSQYISISFDLVYGACYIRYCKNDARDFYCTECFSGFLKTINGLCDCANYSSQGVCNCPTGYIYNSTSKMCEINRDMCLSRNSAGTCLQCPYQYDSPSSFNGQCVPLFCLSWQSVSTNYIECKVCIPNFVLKDGLCVSTFCLTYENRTGFVFPQCISCQSGYTPWSNYCIPKNCNSTTYNLTSGLCASCSGFGFTLSPDRKSCIVANCENPLPPDQCQQCKIGYQNFTGLCIANNCSSFNDTTCTGCIDGFSIKNGLCEADYCLRFDNSRLCIECSNGFILNSNKTCTRVNCLSDSKDRCMICIRAFTYVINLQRCAPANCETYSSDYQTCTICKAGYYKENGTCLDIYCDINSFSSDYKCQICQEGYSFNAQGLCYPTNPGFCPLGQYYSASANSCVNIPTDGCQIFINNQCMVCSSGFFLWGGLCYSTAYCSQWSYFSGCITCLPNYYLENRQCKLYQQDPNCLRTVNSTCAQCVNGYTLISGRCVVLPPNCVNVDESGRCISCAAGYTLSSNLCTITDSNCQTFNSEGRCTLCKTGFYINSQGKCQASPTNCLLVNSNGQCTQCSVNYTLQNGVCYRNHNFCIRYSESTGFCAQCQQNFTLQGIECECSSDSQVVNNVSCIKLPNNCLQIDFSTLRCSRCAFDFSLDSNWNCVRNDPAFCSIYNASNGVCVECLANYVLTNNTCILCGVGQVKIGNQCFPSVSNCLNYSSIGQCLACALTFRLLNGNCEFVTPPNFCSIYDPNTGICTECLPNYVLSNNNCALCPSNQVKVGNQCFPNVLNCITYLPSGLCSTCQEGYILENGLCSTIAPPLFCSLHNPNTGICSQCIVGYTVTQNGLQCIINNCVTMSSDSRTCVQCSPSYIWSNNECRFVTDFCLSYSNGLCSSCEVSNSLNQSRCVPANCQTYSYVNGVCTACISNYQLLNKRCYINIPGCQTYLSTGLCSQCIQGYNLIGGNCVLIIEVPKFCENYNETLGVCIKCANGYTPTSNGKLCQLTNCQIMDTTGTICSQCVSPFQWNNQLCVYVTDFCLSYSNGYCVSCSNFSRLDRNRCVPNFCSNYNYNNGICDTCLSGYIVQAKRCILNISFCTLYSSETGACIQCQSGYSIVNNGLSCQISTVPGCFAQSSSSSCDRCQYRHFESNTACSEYLPFCINIDPFGKCISCCFGSTLVNGTCRKDSSIKYCTRQAGGQCQECQSGYAYCAFCEVCLPISPNCKTYNSNGACQVCVDNFVLLNGVCISQPVGYVTGAVGTCRSGYYLNAGNCYRNANELKLYSTTVPINNVASASATAGNTATNTFTAKKSGDPLVIFGITITTNIQNVPSNAAFILYYRSKVNDPIVCWNTCVATAITSGSFVRDLVQPIVAVEVQVYLVNHLISNVGVDFKIL